MVFFKQIIFPPNSKVSQSILGSYRFDFWIVGSTVKELWAKCPICFNTHKIMDLHISETMMRKYLNDYQPFHYGRVIRTCPNIAIHRGESCQHISNK